MCSGVQILNYILLGGSITSQLSLISLLVYKRTYQLLSLKLVLLMLLSNLANDLVYGILLVTDLEQQICTTVGIMQNYLDL